MFTPDDAEYVRTATDFREQLEKLGVKPDRQQRMINRYKNLQTYIDQESPSKFDMFDDLVKNNSQWYIIFLYYYNHYKEDQHVRESQNPPNLEDQHVRESQNPSNLKQESEDTSAFSKEQIIADVENACNIIPTKEEMKIIGKSTIEEYEKNVTLPKEKAHGELMKVTAAAGYPGGVALTRGLVHFATSARSSSIAQVAVKVGASSIGAAAVLACQVSYQFYCFATAKITWQQLVKYSTVHVASGASSVGGAMIGATAGAALGSIIPGVGTVIGGIVGAILFGVVFGAGSSYLGAWIGNLVVNDEEHFCRVERKRQYKDALRVFDITEKDLISRDILETKKRMLYFQNHPDKFQQSKQIDQHNKFISICAAYYLILFEKGWDIAPEDPPAPSQLSQ